MARAAKGKRWGRWVRGLVVGVLTLLIVLTAAAAFLVGTTPGGRLALSVAESFLPEDLSIDVQDFSGRLFGRFEFHGIRFETPSIRLAARRMALDWKGIRLLAGRINVRTADLEGVEVTLLTPPPDSAPAGPDVPLDTSPEPPAADLPFEITFDSVHVSDVTYRMRDTVWVSGGSATASGTLEDYRLSLSGEGSVPGFASGALRLSGTGSTTEFHAETLELRALDGTVSGAAEASWWPELTWSARLEGKELAPAPLLPEPDEWPGRVSFSVHTQGRIDSAGQIEAEAVVDTLSGVLRGEALEGRFDARLAHEVLLLDAARVTWGSARVSASGTVGGTIDADFDATVPDLGLVMPGSSGRLTASGRASGSVEAVRIQATFAADSVVTEPVSTARLRGEADIELGGAVTGRMIARRLQIRGAELDSAAVRLSGLIDRHEVSVAAVGPTGELDVRVTGGLSPANEWSGTVESLRVASDSAGSWVLAGPVRLAASAESIELGEACLESPPARACAAGRLSATLKRVRFAADSFEVARLAPLMPDGLSARAIIEADINVELVRGAPLSGTAALRTGPGHL
ncbi:MAG: hypothetical protein KJP18_15850, partial [Gemmatimonadetes bacterium]|nr:hypothetical protein [Gemmatimonadota bacterium]